MAAGDIVVEGDTGREAAFIEIATAGGGVAKVPVVIVRNADGTAAGGTQYVEDVALPADPTGRAIILRQATSPASQGAANGDGVAQGGTAKGEAFVKDADLTALFVQPFPLATLPYTYPAAASGIANTTTAVTFIAAHATLRNYVSAFQITWEALTTATELAIRDGAGGTVLWRMKIPASLAGARDVVLPIPLKGTAVTLLEIVTLTASGAGAVYFNAQGFQAA